MSKYIKCHVNPRKDLTGMSFGRWTALRPVGKTKNSSVVWECICACGTIRNVVGVSLSIGGSKSCGCIMREKPTITHGMYYTVEYKTWSWMLTRCRNENTKDFEGYIGRGIDVCDEWLKFENFYRDMGKKPYGYQLDRKDNDKGYSKDNCKWSTPSENSNNRRSCHYVTIDRKTQSLTDWAREFNINPQTVISRVCKLKWNEIKALTTPVRKNNRYKKQ